MKEQKKIMAGRNAWFGLLALVLVLISVPVLFSAEVKAATPNWKTAYGKILKNWRLVEQYDDMSYLKTYFGKSHYTFNRYFTYDVDKDGTPELFLHSTKMGITEVLTYRKKIISLGYYDIERINKKTKEIIVHGHWHGAGGSWDNEWSIYKVGKKAYNQKYYMDDMTELTDGAQGVTVYNSKWKIISRKRSYYDKIYNKHIKNATKIWKFKMYKLTDKKGLRK